MSHGQYQPRPRPVSRVSAQAIISQSSLRSWLFSPLEGGLRMASKMAGGRRYKNVDPRPVNCWGIGRHIWSLEQRPRPQVLAVNHLASPRAIVCTPPRIGTASMYLVAFCPP